MQINKQSHPQIHLTDNLRQCGWRAYLWFRISYSTHTRLHERRPCHIHRLIALNIRNSNMF